MMHFGQKSISIALLLFGFAVLGVSLIAANKVSTGDTSRLARQRLYVGRTVLPDHVLYPALMVRDRVQLLLADHQKQILLRVSYADRRYRYASELHHADQQALAYATLSKSQKYLFEASNAVLADPSAVDAQTKESVRAALELSVVRLTQFKRSATQEHIPAIDQLILETNVLLQSMTVVTE